MSRVPRLGLLCLTAFLVATPLTFESPGLPAGLKADEPAYFLMALSLAEDGDLRADTGDLSRLFDHFPFSPTNNLILMTDDGWRTAYFGKPYLYSLFAAPFAKAWGPGGVVAFNMALLAGMIWLGSFYLARFNGGGLAALFAAGFFLMSAGTAYAFWIHPEVFNMAAVTACLYLGLFSPGEVRPPHGDYRAPSGWRASPALRAAAAGAALGLAVYNKPMLALLGAAPAWRLLQRREWRGLAAFLLGSVLSLGGAAGIAWGLTGHATTYLGVTRGSFEVCRPDTLPVAAATGPTETATAGGGAVARRPASWWWIFRIPELRPAEFLENLRYFLWGRHTGLFIYFPFAPLCLLLFLAPGRSGYRSARRWTLLATLAAIALFFLLWIPFNWHGGGGFVGNRYYVNAYPGFLFLVTALRPAWTALVGYALGSVFLGTLLLSPLGRSVPFPTLQSHARGFPFELLPLELSLRNVPGYATVQWGGVRFRGRRDVFLPYGDQAWIRGAGKTEIWLTTGEPLERPAFLVRNLAPGNTVTLRLEGSEERLEFGAVGPSGETRRVILAPGRPAVRHRDGRRILVYRMEVAATTGEVRSWTQWYPPQDCSYFPYRESSEEAFYVGAQLTYLGEARRIEQDLYHVEWQACEAPATVAAGAAFPVRVRLANRSGATWPVAGTVRVALSYHWFTADGQAAVWEGERSSLPDTVPPAATVEAVQRVVAPDRPGRYRLTLDPVFERVSWFSERDPEATCSMPVLVTAAAPAPAAPPPPD